MLRLTEELGGQLIPKKIKTCHHAHQFEYEADKVKEKVVGQFQIRRGLSYFS